MSPVLERHEEARWLSNTWVVAGEEGGPALLVDAGVAPSVVQETLARHKLELRWILLTHHHFDHSCSATELARETGAQVVAHPREVALFRQDGLVQRVLADSERLDCGRLRVEAMHIPGHTAGQLAFRIEGVGVFTGDTLFKGSVGGTRAPGHTDFTDLRRSLMERLLALPDETPVLPGHRLPTTIGEERRSNPFLRVMAGVDAEGTEQAVFDGTPVRLVVWARDYDGGHKAWIRYPDGTDHVVPGSRVRRQPGV